MQLLVRLAAADLENLVMAPLDWLQQKHIRMYFDWNVSLITNTQSVDSSLALSKKKLTVLAKLGAASNVLIAKT